MLITSNPIVCINRYLNKSLSNNFKLSFSQVGRSYYTTFTKTRKNCKNFKIIFHMTFLEKKHTKNIWYTKNFKVINRNYKWLQTSFYRFLKEQAKIKNQRNLKKKKERRNGNLLVERERSRIAGWQNMMDWGALTIFARS